MIENYKEKMKKLGYTYEQLNQGGLTRSYRKSSYEGRFVTDITEFISGDIRIIFSVSNLVVMSWGISSKVMGQQNGEFMRQVISHNERLSI